VPIHDHNSCNSKLHQKQKQKQRIGGELRAAAQGLTVLGLSLADTSVDGS